MCLACAGVMLVRVRKLSGKQIRQVVSELKDHVRVLAWTLGVTGTLYIDVVVKCISRNCTVQMRFIDEEMKRESGLKKGLDPDYHMRCPQ